MHSAVEHTPGPWSIHEREGSLFIGAPIEGSELRSQVARIAGPAIASDSAANARLIAAAPDLFRMVEKLTSTLRAHKISCRERDEAHALLASLCAQVEA